MKQNSAKLTARDGSVSDCSSAVQCIRGSHIAVESVAVWDDLRQLHRHTNNCSVQSVSVTDSGVIVSNVNVPAGNMVFSDVIFLPGEGTRPRQHNQSLL